MGDILRLINRANKPFDFAELCNTVHFIACVCVVIHAKVFPGAVLSRLNQTVQMVWV